MSLDETPNISGMWNLADEDRAVVLADQATLPSDLVNPADAMGDGAWKDAVDADLVGMGANALADFQYRWDWEMTPAQRASALADVAMAREADSLIENVAEFAAKPPVDPYEYAATVASRRAERARRT